MVQGPDIACFVGFPSTVICARGPSFSCCEGTAGSCGDPVAQGLTGPYGLQTLSTRSPWPTPRLFPKTQTLRVLGAH